MLLLLIFLDHYLLQKLKLLEVSQTIYIKLSLLRMCNPVFYVEMQTSKVQKNRQRGPLEKKLRNILQEGNK